MTQESNKKAILTEDGEKIKEKIEVNDAIYVMPEKFRKSVVVGEEGVEHGKTGLIVLIIGVVIALLSLSTLFIYLSGGFSAEEKAVAINNEVPENKKEPVEVVKKTEINKKNKPINNNKQVDNEEEELEIIQARDDVATSTSNILASTTDTLIASTTESIASSSTPVVENKIPQVISSLDVDADGLTDLEEKLLGTSDINDDSDSDSYTDQDELSNLYNPAGTGLLKDNPLIASYGDSKNKFKFYYPAEITLDIVDSSGIVVVNLNDNESIQVLVSLDNNGLSAKDWYSKTFAVDLDNILMYDKEGFMAVLHKNGNIVYITDDMNDRMFIVSYSALLDKFNYRNIFNMIVNSLERI